MTELPERKVSIAPADGGPRKTFILEPTEGDIKRARIRLSAEDRNALPKYEWPDGTSKAAPR